MAVIRRSDRVQFVVGGCKKQLTHSTRESFKRQVDVLSKRYGDHVYIQPESSSRKVVYFSEQPGHQLVEEVRRYLSPCANFIYLQRVNGSNQILVIAVASNRPILDCLTHYAKLSQVMRQLWMKKQVYDLYTCCDALLVELIPAQYIRKRKVLERPLTETLVVSPVTLYKPVDQIQQLKEDSHVGRKKISGVYFGLVTFVLALGVAFIWSSGMGERLIQITHWRPAQVIHAYQQKTPYETVSLKEFSHAIERLSLGMGAALSQVSVTGGQIRLTYDAKLRSNQVLNQLTGFHYRTRSKAVILIPQAQQRKQGTDARGVAEVLTLSQLIQACERVLGRDSIYPENNDTLPLAEVQLRLEVDTVSRLKQLIRALGQHRVVVASAQLSVDGGMLNGALMLRIPQQGAR